MNEKIYEKNEYMIFRVRNGYIVYNSKKPFKEGHTHLENFNASVCAINLCIKKQIPKNKSYYYLRSLVRISNDEAYKEKINLLITVKKSKSNQCYRNKGGRRAK